MGQIRWKEAIEMSNARLKAEQIENCRGVSLCYENPRCQQHSVIKKQTLLTSAKQPYSSRFGQYHRKGKASPRVVSHLSYIRESFVSLLLLLLIQEENAFLSKVKCKRLGLRSTLIDIKRAQFSPRVLFHLGSKLTKRKQSSALMPRKERRAE